jgi:hypothetical protein
MCGMTRNVLIFSIFLVLIFSRLSCIIHFNLPPVDLHSHSLGHTHTHCKKMNRILGVSDGVGLIGCNFSFFSQTATLTRQSAWQHNVKQDAWRIGLRHVHLRCFT